MLEKPSFICRFNSSYLAQNFNRAFSVTLPKLCNLHTKVWNVMKSQVGRYNWSPASRDKAARWLCLHSVQARRTIKTQAGSPSLII